MKLIKGKIVLGITFFLLMAFACSKEKSFDCLKSTGPVKNEIRSFPSISSIRVEDNVAIVLRKAMDGQIVIEAGEHLLPKISTKEEFGVLVIRNENTCNWVRSYKVPVTVYVGLDKIKEINAFGFGSITTQGMVTSDSLNIYTWTTGDVNASLTLNRLGFIADDKTSIKIKGKVPYIAGRAFKNAKVDIQEVTTQYLYMINASVLDADVFSDSLVSVEILGDGFVRCKGKPGIVNVSKISGKGELKLID